MTLESSRDVRATSKERQSMESGVSRDLRLKIVKIWENDADNSYIIGFERILGIGARQVAYLAGINYEALCTADRLLLTRFRCPLCGVLPLYFLDLKYLNKVRCGKCSVIIALKNSSGKYGKLRKKIAVNTCKMIDEMLNSN